MVVMILLILAAVFTLKQENMAVQAE